MTTPKVLVGEDKSLLGEVIGIVRIGHERREKRANGDVPGLDHLGEGIGIPGADTGDRLVQIPNGTPCTHASLHTLARPVVTRQIESRSQPPSSVYIVQGAAHPF